VEVKFLALSYIIALHETLIQKDGGEEGIRDIGLLKSAVAMPEQSFDGQFLHESIFDMAAAYMFHIVKDHPFVDGNKRVGLAAALTFLDINGYEIEAEEDELFELTDSLASGRKDISKAEIAEFFRQHCTKRR